MAKYGRLKRAFFEDGMIIETERVSYLKRCVRLRRDFEGYFGRVWFRPTAEWREIEKRIYNEFLQSELWKDIKRRGLDKLFEEARLQNWGN